MSGSLPKETLAQVLIYLAENEKFSSLKGLRLPPERVKEALKELGEEILYGLEASNEEVEEILEDLSPKAKQVLSELSEDDRQKLFSKFVQ
ncbi:MAG: hypothetical protein KDK66_04975 [Deltaproteobacteria bacterium]|nr:hypothetical protein [Deltaproteobacteria bacterium]